MNERDLARRARISASVDVLRRVVPGADRLQERGDVYEATAKYILFLRKKVGDASKVRIPPHRPTWHLWPRLWSDLPTRMMPQLPNLSLSVGIILEVKIRSFRGSEMPITRCWYLSTTKQQSRLLQNPSLRW